MQLRGLAAERRDADRVLEQPARVAVVPVGARSRERPVRPANVVVRQHGARQLRQPLVRELGDEEIEEPFELVCVAAQRGHEPGRVCFSRRLEAADVELEPLAVALHPPEHVDGVSLPEQTVEQLDVTPHPRLDAPGRIDELECQVRRTGACPQAPLARHRVHAVNGPVLGELGDRRHSVQSMAAGGRESQVRR